jgi:hypothetical protein
MRALHEAPTAFPRSSGSNQPKETQVKYFHELTPQQQSLAVAYHAKHFRAALNRGSCSFVREPKDREAMIAALASAMAEDAVYSETEIRTELSVRTPQYLQDRDDRRGVLLAFKSKERSL